MPSRVTSCSCPLRSNFTETGSFDVRNDLDALFNTHPHNVFLLKINRWFSI